MPTHAAQTYAKRVLFWHFCHYVIIDEGHIQHFPNNSSITDLLKQLYASFACPLGSDRGQGFKAKETYIC